MSASPLRSKFSVPICAVRCERKNQDDFVYTLQKETNAYKQVYRSQISGKFKKMRST